VGVFGKLCVLCVWGGSCEGLARGEWEPERGRELIDAPPVLLQSRTFSDYENRANNKCANLT
jgi:hypothetical protein